MPNYYESGGRVADSGFESRSDTAAITAGGDIIAVNTPGTSSVTASSTHPGYRPSTGQLSTMGAKVTGTASDYAYLQIWNGASVSATNGEIRFWVYFSALGSHSIYDQAQTFDLEFTAGGNIQVYINAGETVSAPYVANTYNTIGTYAASTLYQFRIVYNFTSKTMQISHRSAIGGSWTQLQRSGASDYNIPFRAAAATESYYVAFQSGGAAQSLWLDEFQIANSAITDAILSDTGARRNGVRAIRGLYTR